MPVSCFLFGGRGGIRKEQRDGIVSKTFANVTLFRNPDSVATLKKHEQGLVRCRAFCLAEEAGFEPASLFLDYRISSAGRCDHFDTLPNRHNICLIIIYKNFVFVKHKSWMPTSF